MKQIVLYSIILAATLIIPQRGTDVGRLKPVEVIFLGQEGELFSISTDTKDRGVGATIPAAVQDLKETTAGNIFLDTADYLIVSEQAVRNIGELAPYLHKSVRVCIGPEDLDLEKAARFLSVHKPKNTLKNVQAGIDYQRLIYTDSRINFKKA